MSDRSVTDVLLVEDHTVFRETLREFLHAQPDINVVGDVADGDDALRFLRDREADVVVMDVSLPRLSGLAATRMIVARHPQTRVVGLTMHDSDWASNAMCNAGAVACLTKNASAQEVYEAIRRAAEAPPEA